MNCGHGPSAHFSARPPFAHHPGAGFQHRTPSMMPHAQSPFGRLDTNADGKITKDEVMQVFAKVDADGDGSITKEELLKSLHAVTSQRPDAGPQAQGDQPTGPSGPRGGAGAGRPSFGRGSMGHGPMGGGGPMESGPFGGVGRQGPPSPSSLLEHFDKNKDGKLTKDELPEFLWNRLSKADTNSDGEITKDEIEAHMKSIRSDGTSKPEERRSDDKPTTEAANEAKST